MTDKIAIWIGLIVVALVAYDYVVNEGAAALFLLRKLADFIEYLAFWR